jgi:DnaK suppressor protein
VTLTVTEIPHTTAPSAGRGHERPGLLLGTTSRRPRLTLEQRVGFRQQLERLAEMEVNRVETIATLGGQQVAAYDIGLRQAVHDALAKLAGGTYGDCEVCHVAIPVERLELVPYARRCVRCQERMEGGWDQPRRLVGSIVRTRAGEPQGPSELHDRLHAAS